MAYSLTNTTKKKSSSSSSSSGGNSITVTRSEREAKRKGSSGSSGSVSSGGSNYSSGGSRYSSGSTNTLTGTNTSGIKYNPNKDYAAAIQDAIKNGASNSEIDRLNAERNAKIQGQNLSYDKLTDGDIASYKRQSAINRGDYVIGQDDSDQYTYNPSDEYIRGLSQSLHYDPNNLRGYADPTGYYTTRQTAYVWEQPDGSLKTTYSSATNYNQALADAIAAGQVASGSTLKRADTYGTGSLTGDSYNYGVTSTGTGGYSGFGNGYEGGRYTSDNQYGNMYDMNNMQLEFLSGRDGMDYSNPYAGLAYNGNGMNNAYNAGTQFAGQGSIMGSYGVEGPNMDNTYPSYGTAGGYVGLTADDIQSQFDDVYSQYQDAIDERNAALAASYNQQRADLEGQSEEQQRANYINYKLAGLNMPAQLQAAGINGGVAESTLAGLESDYMTNYNSTANALTDAVTQLEIAKNNAIADGNLEAANMYAQLSQNSLSLQMQAAQAETAYNQWVQEMAFARTQWEYEQARYQAELAYQQQQDAENRSFEWMKIMADMGLSIGDSSYLQGLGFDTSYFDKYQDAQLQGLLLDNKKKSASLSKSRSSRSSGGGNKYDDEVAALLDGTPGSNQAINQYISDTIRRNGTGAMYVPGFDTPLTEDYIKSALSSGKILADITDNKVTLGSPSYMQAAGYK